LRTLSLCLLLALPGVLATAQKAEESPIDRLTPGDLDQGRRLFGAHCARCHGVGGTGGEGPSLNRPTLRRATSDQALFDLLRAGVPERGMPGTWQLSDGELWRLAGYARSLGSVEEVVLAGDPARGRDLFESTCVDCHMIAGQGGSLGPDLSDVGARRGARFLYEHVSNPGPTVAEEYLMVRVTTRDAHQVRGMRVNEDAFTLQLRDMSNRFHSFEKAALTEWVKEPGQTFMPAYARRLSRAELEDLVAFLAGLRGEK
jgi:putative heme-binding domain-containing protein